MAEQKIRPSHKIARAWMAPLMLLGSVALLWLVFLVGVEYLALTLRSSVFFTSLTGFDVEEVRSALSNYPEVVVGILGVALTMVSFILQLAATRYTPRVTEMFFRDRVNLLVMSFFVVASVQCVWATFFTSHTSAPHVMVFMTLMVISLAILILIPYFSYVFAFLEPARIVSRLQDLSLKVAVARTRGDIEPRQVKVLDGIEQLADVAINSTNQKDRIIAANSVDALKDLVIRYLKRKGDLDENWFKIGPCLLHNPDFVSMVPHSLDALNQSGTWLEWKVLRQFQNIFHDALGKMWDVSQLVAINTRYIGEAALSLEQKEVLKLSLIFFNTYLRSAINERDVRTAYNTLYQYRNLVETQLRQGATERVIEAARYFKYYGHLAHQSSLAFINETVGYDLCALCELAHDLGSPLEEELLAIFLEVDKMPETEVQENSLRGVRKAQLKLATYYLVKGREDLARQVFKDMEFERPERLSSIKDEMLEVKERAFWENIDRGDNFDFLDEQRRAMLDVFFSWFAWAPAS